jgi:hypothetical protein
LFSVLYVYKGRILPAFVTTAISTPHEKRPEESGLLLFHVING